MWRAQSALSGSGSEVDLEPCELARMGGVGVTAVLMKGRCE